MDNPQKNIQKRIEEEIYIGSDPIRTQIYLQGISCQAILDSGSSLNIINEELWKNLSHLLPHLTMRHDPTLIEGIAGRAQNLGLAILQVQIGPISQPFEFLIVRNPRVFVLLGVPVLKSLGASLDFREEVIRVQEYVQPFVSMDRLDEQQFICPTSRIPLRPRTITMVECRPAFHLSKVHDQYHLPLESYSP